MSTVKGTFTPKQIQELKSQFRETINIPTLPFPTPVPVENAEVAKGISRMFPYDVIISKRFLGMFLGISATAVGFYFGARYFWPKTETVSEVYKHSYENGHHQNMQATTKQVKFGSIQGDRNDLLRQTVKVTLHQCPRGYNTPCISPFSLKLETFLRVANIPYEVKYTAQPHAKNSPWLTVGDNDITDSHECIMFLCNTFNINLERGAKPSRLTASRLVSIQLDNHIYWGIALWRWVYDKGASLKEIQPLSPQAFNVIESVSESVRRAAWCHGLGRLPYEKVLETITTDLADLSAALGRNLYFMGEHPGEVDCNAFAMLAQIIWNMPSSPFEKELLKYDNLVQFVYRMRDNYWPDWEQLLHKPGEQKFPEKFYYPAFEFIASMTGFRNAESGGTSSDNSSTNIVSAHGTQPNPGLRARSMPLNPNGSSSLPVVPSRIMPTPSKNAPPMRQESKSNDIDSVSQAQLKSIQTMLNDLNKQLGFTKDTNQNQQLFYNNNNNNYSGNQSPIPPQGGGPNSTAFYPSRQQSQSGSGTMENLRETPVYYTQTHTSTPSYYPSNAFYPNQNQPR